MEMHQIRYFLAVARTLNFTRAAEESNVTQPSLTRAIQKLEEEFGGLLFRRERSLTHLTDMGKLMLPHLKRTYEAAQAAKSLAKGIGKAAVLPLNLGFAAKLPSKQLYDAIGDVARGLPGFQLSIADGEAESLLQSLMKGDLDLVVAAEPRQMHERLDVITLFIEQYVILAPLTHSIANVVNPCLSDLAATPWIEGPSDHTTGFRERCTNGGAEPNYRHIATRDEEIGALVAAGLGCGLVARRLSIPDNTKLIELAEMDLQVRVLVVTVSGRKRSIAVDALIRALKSRSWP
jgi:DNA-binding transcriptional LysR family regulator